MTIERTSNDFYPQDASVGPMNGSDRTVESAPDSSETQLLTWELCDGTITDDEQRRLENLLTESEQSRDEYLSIVSIHQSLIEIFCPKSVAGIHCILPT